MASLRDSLGAVNVEQAPQASLLGSFPLCLLEAFAQVAPDAALQLALHLTGFEREAGKTLTESWMFSDEGFQIVSGFDAYVHHVDPSAMVRVLRSEKSMVAGQEYVQPPASFNPLQRIMEVVVRFRFGASLSHPPLLVKSQNSHPHLFCSSSFRCRVVARWPLSLASSARPPPTLRP